MACDLEKLRCTWFERPAWLVDCSECPRHTPPKGTTQLMDCVYLKEVSD
jgi:hypothetical protein